MEFTENTDLPSVTLCTPTFNRRPFIPSLIRSIQKQTYPQDKMEWVIVDDGTDKIEDMVKDIPNVKYFSYETKMSLGEKRNIMHTKATGDILVYIDDDDYYPPERVSHAVETLQKFKHIDIVGSSAMNIYFKHINQMYTCGPYGENHATAATFAFKRRMLADTSYEDHTAVGEEKTFLKNYTIPLMQLDSKKTILVFSHNHNSFDKKELLQQTNKNKFIRESDVKVEDIVKDEETIQFILHDIDQILEGYKPGEPSNKKDVELYMKIVKKSREEMMGHLKKQHESFQAQANAQFEELKKTHEAKMKSVVEEFVKDNKKLKEKNTYLEQKMKTLLSELIECKGRLKILERSNLEALD